MEGHRAILLWSQGLIVNTVLMDRLFLSAS